MACAQRSHRLESIRWGMPLITLAVLTVLDISTPISQSSQTTSTVTGEEQESDSGLPVVHPDSLNGPTGPWPRRPLTNWAFGVGESLSYAIGWEKIVAGYGQMFVDSTVDTLGRTCYPIVSTVRTTPFFSAFFKVDDRVATLLDVREIFPLRFDKRLTEGKYRSDRTVVFDPDRGLAYTPTDTFPVPPYCHDDLSLLYYVRTLSLAPNQDLELDILSSKKLYRLKVKILRKERITVKAGTFSTIVVEPLLQSAGLFKHEGKVTVWLTDDRLHLPVLMKSKVVVGSIVAELEHYRLGQMRRY